MKRKTGRVLTAARLINLGACSGAVERFTTLFGESVKVTKTRAVKHANELNFWWAGANLLSVKRGLQFNRFYQRLSRQYNHEKITYRQMLKAIAAEFARLYNMDG